MKARKIKFLVHGAKWFDRVNGNTYHSVAIKRVRDGKILRVPMQYGYGDQYKYTAFEAMLKAGWIPKKDNTGRDMSPNTYQYENNYPIEWMVTDGLKRDCIANGHSED